ncbi:putative 5-hydroxytryptamine receptor 7 [Hypsibius exemplaris]|uniref:5-hydroxytryptamine receptor 7 n=1 Tax=Hypsibius exemplaris TaxID=2072580 RepID=A0A1W0WQK4_HYPEX|nr:putative 5-hydroxytryptamine receptor 7 [Hypsibius exemplaris]
MAHLGVNETADESTLIALQYLSNGTDNASTDSSPFPYMYIEHHFAWMVLTALIIGCATLIGTLGNILIILAVCCVRGLRTSGNVFLLNLALADMIVTVLIDPFNVVGAVAGRKVLLANYSLCNFVASFCGPACLSSMWNMCAISLNRYICICKPHLYPRIFTFKSSIIMCVGIWIGAHLLHMPNHLGWGHNRFTPLYYICTFDMATYSYGVFYIVTGVIIPLCGVLFGYTAIFFKVRGAKLQIRQHRHSVMIERTRPSDTPARSGEKQPAEPANRQRHKKLSINIDDVKLAKTLFAAFLAFLICWSLVVFFILANNPDSIPGWLFVVAIIMAHGNSAVNPILYGFTNDKFREGYRNVLGFTRRVRASVGDSSHPTRKGIPAVNSKTLSGGQEKSHLTRAAELVRISSTTARESLVLANERPGTSRKL